MFETKPDAALVKMFDTMFPIYKETRDRMRPIWRAVQTARQSSET